MSIQLDLFGQVEALESDGFTVLADYVPHTLELLLSLDTIAESRHFSRPWAYSYRPGGFCFEHERTWKGWDSTPAHEITWAELVHALEPHAAEVDHLRELAQPFTGADRPIDAWRYFYRPFELWPRPESWHPSYITGDHARPGWTQRLAAWTATVALCRQLAAGIAA